jgi:hypothetical protein
MLSDGRGVPLGSLKLWAAGQADRWLSQRESAWYDVGPAGFNAGAVDYANGLPTLEYLPMAQLGETQTGALVCRPRLVLQDTHLSDYTVTGGGWEERYPQTGAVRKYRLVQYDGTADIQWSAESTFPLPANPSVAFSLVFLDTPSDWDEATYPPHIQLTFGAGQWGLYITKSDVLLLGMVGGSLQPIASLPAPRSADNSDNSESLIVLRCHRGQVGISTDGGDRYQWVPGVVAAGAFTVSGQGGMLVFGFHQLAMEQGVWLSPNRHARVIRPLSPALQFEARDDETYGSVAYTDLSAPTSGTAQYSVELTPTTDLLGCGWSCYRSPEVYAVTTRYVAIPSAFGGTGFSEIQPDLLEANIDKPRELDGAGGSVVVRLDPETANYWNRGDFAKFELSLGHQIEGGGDYLQVVLVGFVCDITVTNETYNSVDLAMKLTTVAERFRRARWNKLDTFPLGGRTLNQALDLILETEGLPANTSYRQWDFVGGLFWGFLGDRVVIPLGMPEDPFEWPVAGECKWATMQRLAGYFGLEVVPLDNGILTTVPKRYLDPVVSATYQADALNLSDTELQRLALRLRWRRNSQEKATSVLLDGVDENGNPIFVYATDDAAEQNPLSPRFTPFRVEIQETLDGTVSPGLLASRAGELAREFFIEPISVDLTHSVDLTLSRGQRVRVEGFEAAGVNPLYDFRIATLRHTYRAEGGFGPSLATEAGLEVVF